MVAILEKLNSFVWGIPTLVLILGVGLYITVRTKFAQVRLFPAALKAFISNFQGRNKSGDGISAYQALCTALAATVGTGNLAGVAGAIAIGGPGAVFWMWICAFFGMVTKYAEAVLAVRYRRKNEAGEYVGGPMYIIRDGMGNHWGWLAGIYSFFGVIAAFGVGNATQINAVIGGISGTLRFFGIGSSRWGDLLLGVCLAVLVGLMLMGGAKGIGRATERIVPFAAVLYMLLGVGVLIVRSTAVPKAFASIIAGAWHPSAVTGGVIGSAFQALRVGTSRGVFTNEAGMGTASIAHAGANVQHPTQQGLLGIVEVFLDTVVICTMTALVILCSGVDVGYGVDQGVSLTVDAFSAVYGGWITVPIALSLCCFAIATVLGWGLYGIRCAQYLFGDRVWKGFVLVQVITVVVAAVLQTGTVWMLSETVNGLMAIPNLIALAYMTPEVCALTRSYIANSRKKLTNLDDVIK